MNKRESTIDILKAIGIISIVIGHCSGTIFKIIPIGRFVYLYHLMIFFFVAGYCFKKSDAMEPAKYVGKRLTSLYSMFLKYGVVFVLLHNVFVKWHLIDASKYSLDDIIMKLSNVMLMRSSESLLSACWFLAVLFFSSAVFCVIFCWGENCSKPIIAHGIIAIIMGGVGLYLNWNKIHMDYHIHTAFLALPVYYVGYYYKNHKETLERFVTGPGTLVATFLLYILAANNWGKIELAAEEIYSVGLFYPITIVGIYFCLGLAKLISKNRGTEKVFSYIGRNSFHIMALHFLCFKIVDFVYGNMKGIEGSQIEVFPKAFFLWPIYYVVGIFGPLFIIEIIKHTIKRKENR